MSEVSYTKRLEAVQELGHLFPGIISPLGFSNRELGLFAGIYLQTKWQMDSKRDLIPLWYLINKAVTLDPFTYAQEFISNPQSSSDLLTKQSWYEYFRACRDNKKFGLTRLLWKAHNTAIRYSLWEYREEFQKTQTTPQEVAFWQGWVRVVLGFENLAPPTNDLLIVPALGPLMPSHSPIGSKKENLYKRIFLNLVSRGVLPQEEFVQKYSLLS